MEAIKRLILMLLMATPLFAAPAIQGVNIQPAKVFGNTAPMQCFVNATELTAVTMNVSYEWYKNNVNTSYGGYVNTTANANRSISNLTPSNWDYNQNWSCRVRANNGSTWSSFMNSSNMTILSNINTSIKYPPNNTSFYKQCWFLVNVEGNDTSLPNASRSVVCTANWWNGFSNSSYQAYSTTNGPYNGTMNISVPINGVNTSFRINCTAKVNATSAANDMRTNTTQVVDITMLGTSLCPGGVDEPVIPRSDPIANKEDKDMPIYIAGGAILLIGVILWTRR